jgi:hypothetical protein
MPALPEKQQSDAIAALAEPTFSMEGWPEDAIKREAALIAALPASRAQFTALLETLYGLV